MFIYMYTFNDPEIVLLDIDSIEMKIYVHQSKWARILLAANQWSSTGRICHAYNGLLRHEKV